MEEKGRFSVGKEAGAALSAALSQEGYRIYRGYRCYRYYRNYSVYLTISFFTMFTLSAVMRTK